MGKLDFGCKKVKDLCCYVGERSESKMINNSINNGKTMD